MIHGDVCENFINFMIKSGKHKHKEDWLERQMEPGKRLRDQMEPDKDIRKQMEPDKWLEDQMEP